MPEGARGFLDASGNAQPRCIVAARASRFRCGRFDDLERKAPGCPDPIRRARCHRRRERYNPGPSRAGAATDAKRVSLATTGVIPVFVPRRATRRGPAACIQERRRQLRTQSGGEAALAAPTLRGRRPWPQPPRRRPVAGSSCRNPEDLISRGLSGTLGWKQQADLAMAAFFVSEITGTAAEHRSPMMRAGSSSSIGGGT